MTSCEYILLSRANEKKKHMMMMMAHTVVTRGVAKKKDLFHRLQAAASIYSDEKSDLQDIYRQQLMSLLDMSAREHESRANR
jgi:hypothetical protein